MARAGTAADESIPCVGIDAAVACDRLLQVAASDYRAVSVGANRFRFARSYRPGWAIALGCVLAPTLLGLLFFLVRRSESWDAFVEEDHRSVTLRVQGELLASTLAGLRQAAAWGPYYGDSMAAPSPPAAAPMAAPSPPAPSPPAAAAMADWPAASGPTSPPWRQAPAEAPAEPADQQWATVPLAAPPPVDSGWDHTPIAEGTVDDRTVIASLRKPLDPISPLVPVALCFDTGERHRLGTSLLVGRDPVAGAEPESPAADTLAIADPDRSVSKTHLLVRRDGTHVTVTDRGSTNGTAIVDPQGALIPAAPSEPVRVAIGSTVRFGKRSFLVVEDTQ